MALHDTSAAHAPVKPLQIAGSPRSSVSLDASHSPRTPASPFLHNLHHRFRKGSNASSSISSDATTSYAAGTHIDPSERAETAQSAKRFLLSIVRNDWEWPHDAQAEVTEDSLKKDEILAAREPNSWRTRFEAQSDIELDSDGSINGYTRNRKRKPSDPYRFENPDAIATVMVERKLKRRKKVEAEMQWNDGLQLWAVRRDAWTQAVKQVPARHSSLGRQQTRNSELSHQATTIVPPSTGPDINISHRPMESAQTTAKNDAASSWPLTSSAENNLSPASSPPRGKVTESNLVQSTLSAISSNSATEPMSEDADGPYLPIYPPLFPTSHTLRSRIKPAAYPTIYSKVVVQSLTPNVPIPLTHMIGALVDGWKAEGNWPPQMPTEVQSQASRRGRKGETAFGRWRREQDEKKRTRRRAATVEATNAKGAGVGNELDGNGEPVDDDGQKRGFRRSLTGAVKKIFGVNGEEDADGGLERLGVTFSDRDDELENGLLVQDNTGVMKEEPKVQDDGFGEKG